LASVRECFYNDSAPSYVFVLNAPTGLLTWAHAAGAGQCDAPPRRANVGAATGVALLNGLNRIAVCEIEIQPPVYLMGMPLAVMNATKTNRR
jgi:hypothetical protein